MAFYDIIHPTHGDAHPALGDVARLGAALLLFLVLAVAISAFAPEDLATLSGSNWYGNVAVTQRF